MLNHINAGSNELHNDTMKAVGDFYVAGWESAPESLGIKERATFAVQYAAVCSKLFCGVLQAQQLREGLKEIGLITERETE